MTEEIDYTSRFETFFQTFKNEEGETPYRDAIERLELEKEISVPIIFNDLVTFDPDLANATRTNPNQAIEAASAAVRRIVRVVAADYADERVDALLERLHPVVGLPRPLAADRHAGLPGTVVLEFADPLLGCVVIAGKSGAVVDDNMWLKPADHFEEIFRIPILCRTA